MFGNLYKVPLEAENVPDEMEGEQTWPTEEELMAAGKAQKKKKKVPKGTSEYQAAWILDDDEDSPRSPLNDSSDEEMDDLEPGLFFVLFIISQFHPPHGRLSL